MLLGTCGTVFTTIDALRGNADMAALLGMRHMPSSSTVADCLRRLAGWNCDISTACCCAAGWSLA